MMTISAEKFRASAAAIEEEVGKVIVGQKEVVRLVLVSILGGGTYCSKASPDWEKQCSFVRLGKCSI
jgi:MoxR-like ATPase